MTLYPEASRAISYILLIGFSKIAFCDAEIINGIQQIGLTDPIIAADSYDPFPEFESGLSVILELHQ
jgi:hypothetical protein